MIADKNSSVQRPRAKKNPEAIVPPMEEIVVKLDTEEAGIAQAPKKNQKDQSVEADQFKQELDELRKMNQRVKDEIDVLKKSLLNKEEHAAKEAEAIKTEQDEAEQRQVKIEAKIRELEKIISSLREKLFERNQPLSIPPASSVPITEVPVSNQATDQTTAISTFPDVSKQQDDIRGKEKYINITAQLSTVPQVTRERLILQSSIHLSGKDAFGLSKHKIPFEVAWYVSKLNGGGSILLATSKAHLIEHKLEYTIKADTPLLANGPYRLMTAVTFPSLPNLTAYCQGPIIQ